MPEIHSKQLLLIFTRNPEYGKVKTRLAKETGEQVALDIYRHLLEHTVSITKGIDVQKQVFYSEAISSNDIWKNNIYEKKLQYGNGLGERMENAFRDNFEAGYQEIIIIGSDLYDLEEQDLEQAFKELKNNDYVIGPAKDGGYYLLGMKSLNSDIFKNKKWGSNSVLQATLNDLQNNQIKLLEERNDVDVLADIKGHPALRKFLNQSE
ncbi:TIGR04282 family arsenosugar biosynthesis glycosyltransferase [Zunongwangia sp. H14]|uniref:TIGR04282 family arsenosugar biosynthesis glycosyltransferase n=1 Tax=Zunongwangia sp. H14 TaxID=3240792 RepID=UPI00356737FD